MNSRRTIHQDSKEFFRVSEAGMPAAEKSRHTGENHERRLPGAPKETSGILPGNGKLRISAAIENIAFVKAAHVYVSIHFINRQRMLHRESLAGLLVQLPQEQFVQVHRSYIVNLRYVDSWSFTHIFIAEVEIPISRSRRAEVLARLENLKK